MMNVFSNARLVMKKGVGGIYSQSRGSGLILYDIKCISNLGQSSKAIWPKILLIFISWISPNRSPITMAI